MKQSIGKVLEVFIPVSDNVIESDEIGFKVVLDTGVIEIVEKQNVINSNIFKDDVVIVKEQYISGKLFRDIELYNGALYE